MNKERLSVVIYYLYAENDKNKTPRYIGITSKGLEVRLNQHQQTFNLKTPTYKNNWIKSLLNNGIKLCAETIDVTNSWNEACKKEIELISYYRELNVGLTNTTAGGDGLLNMQFSDEARSKISLKARGRKLSFKRKSRSKIHDKNKMTPVACYDLNMNLIQEFECQMDASRSIGIDQGSICRALKNPVAKCQKMYWRYL